MHHRKKNYSITWKNKIPLIIFILYAVTLHKTLFKCNTSIAIHFINTMTETTSRFRALSSEQNTEKKIDTQKKRGCSKQTWHLLIITTDLLYFLLLLFLLLYINIINNTIFLSIINNFVVRWCQTKKSLFNLFIQLEDMDFYWNKNIITTKGNKNKMWFKDVLNAVAF